MNCEINLYMPPDGALVGARGNVISGLIKYTVTIPLLVTGITADVEGTGTLKIEHLQKKDEEGNPETEIRRETYLSVNIFTQHFETVLGLGVYEIPFRIELPHDIPPSLNYHKEGLSQIMSCKIAYNVRIIFHTPDLFPIGRVFRKEINIIAALVPKLPMTSIVHEGEKKLTQLFSSKKSYVKVKANIFNSVLRCGEKIQIQYEVINDTNIVVKEVKVKLVEVYTFKPAEGSEVVMEEKVPDTGSKIVSIPSGDTQEMAVDINIPVDRATLDFASIVSRQYYVLIIVKLPMPHRNYELKIPVQIGHILDESAYSEYNRTMVWDIMNEEGSSIENS